MSRREGLHPSSSPSLIFHSVTSTPGCFHNNGKNVSNLMLDPGDLETFWQVGWNVNHYWMKEKT